MYPEHSDFKKPFLAGMAFVLGIGLLILIVYQIPYVHQRLSWRLDFAMTYLRGVVNPVGAVPTPAGTDNAAALLQPSATAEPTQTAAYTATSAETQSTAQPSATATFTPIPSPTPTPLPPEVELTAPLYEKQDLNNCGPATLALAMNFWGWEGDQRTISELIKPLREDRNVNVEELLYFVSSQAGWLRMTYRVGGDVETIKRFIAAGFPVMIEETFMMAESYWPNDDRWAGHYLLVTGYNDDNQMFTVQDTFVKANMKVSYTDLDRNWQSFNRVYLVVYPTDLQGNIEALLGDQLDEDANRQHALDQATAEAKADPTNALTWFNIGSNLVYFERYNEAASAYDEARKLGLPQRMFRYQFGPFIAYFHAGRSDDLDALTSYALERTPTSEEAMLWRGWLLYRRGDKAGATELFQKALTARPGYGDAQYALGFVQSN